MFVLILASGISLAGITVVKIKKDE
ncbi:MAG: hypothetical protein ACI4L2_00805 [Wujia sp.]